ncbi:Heat shock protein HslJ [Flavobacteriaceae bacterium MAR_2010_188]|nr:Heat shock protein HslJ [Flavobacteriaceae bacterium MAR_2010_188]
MKIQPILFILCIALFTACGTTKDMSKTDQLYNNTWELEYITGPRIAFEGLFPDKKPLITFEKDTNQITGNSGCNGYTAPYALNEMSLKVGEPGISTMMYCGEGEKVFRDMMQKIDTYSFDADGKLTLKMNEVAMMRFKKVSN